MTRSEAIKFFLAGLMAAAFAGGTVWLVRSETGRITETIREAAREAGKEAGNEIGEGIVEGTDRAVDKVAEVPGKMIEDMRDELREEVSEVTRRTVDEMSLLPSKMYGNMRDEVGDDLSTVADRAIGQLGGTPGRMLSEVREMVLGSPADPEQPQPTEPAVPQPVETLPAAYSTSDAAAPEEVQPADSTTASDTPRTAFREMTERFLGGSDREAGRQDPGALVEDILRFSRDVTRSTSGYELQIPGL